MSLLQQSSGTRWKDDGEEGAGLLSLKKACLQCILDMYNIILIYFYKHNLQYAYICVCMYVYFQHICNIYICTLQGESLVPKSKMVYTEEGGRKTNSNITKREFAKQS